ncbi:YihY/virulence factor BrkB family protein [Anaerocolumna sp. AGMB13025]|uniref:YihY/virulence factor BrkB family protein n=1 Tax=Anaerocolumna sp. AGMB13025 TaxID=3039116 RepID=UPI00241D2692|nr:YihY/virulence factor BrkB family protein [Anaerocolumna sp. AGMB13025]WFR56221.1 YihY/virulence factor BrkB family protein [Anaerocolumna sp. AGMB13025]
MHIAISIFRIIRAFNRKVADDFISAFSAQAAFFVMISFFPFIMLLLTLLQYLPIRESVLMTTLTQIFPSSITSLIITIISEIYDKASGTIISITAISALWSASRGIVAIIKGLNSVYAIRETRSYFKLRFLSSVYTFIFALMMIVTLVILVFGNRLYVWIESRIPILKDLALLIISIRTIAGLFILTVFFLLLYVVIPNRTTKVYKELPGALVSAAGWMGFSYLYSFYIDNMSNYSRMYGSLTAIVLFMLWFYFCMYIMFIGGEINVVLSSGDLVYYLKYLFKHRKEYKYNRKLSAERVHILEDPPETSDNCKK